MRLVLLLLLLASGLSKAQTEQIQWMSFNQALEKSKTAPKKVFIDMYTDWCGWCKRMDQTTFADPNVIKYMNENFYAVKFNTEKEGPIAINDSIYKINPAYGRNGTHELAVTLLQGKMSYPTFVFLDERFNILSPLPGYQQPAQIEPVLKYFGFDYHLKMSWVDYQKTFSPTW
jgi:thioredoxin-related protein